MSKRLFITGTGTDVGKTYVTGLILKKLHENGLQAAYYKAAMSGNNRGSNGHLIPGDALHVKTVSGIEQPLEEMCPYLYEYAVSPHLASRLEGNPVRLEHVLQTFDDVCGRYDYVTAEGSGGICCPLCHEEETLQLTDLIKRRNLACLLVAGGGLGAINNVVLSAAYMKAESIPVRGIILNRFQPGHVMYEDNMRMCEALTGLKVVACVKDGDTQLEMSLESLKSLYEEGEGNDLVSI